MQKLKTVLHSKVFYIVVAILILIELPIYLFKTSSYDKNNTRFICILDSYFINENKVDLELSCNEKLLGYIYYNDEKEIDDFKNEYNLKDKVEIEGTLEEIKDPTNINAFNYKQYYKTRGIYYRLKISKIEKIESYNKIYSIYNYFFNRINNLKSKDYIYSLVFGNKKYLDNDTLDMYKKIGIMHMFSVSGMHISIIVELLNKVIKKDSTKKNLFILIILFLYYLIIHTISLQRAFISYLITYINKRYDLEINKYLKVLLIITIILLINPSYIFDSSFYLSVITGSALIIYSDKLNSNNLLVNVIKISIFSFLITFPLVTYIYNEVNVLAFLFNIITSLIITYIIFPLSIITIIFSFTDSLLYLIINCFENIIGYLSVFSINLIFKKEIVFVLIYYVLIYLIFKNRKYIFIFLLAVFIHYNINKFIPNNYVYFFDVGQGDSILLSMNNHYYLFDTGGKPNGKDYYGEKVIIPTLKSLGISHLDIIIISHGDEDHAKESIPIINNFNVDEVYLNNNEINELEEKIIETGIKYKKMKNKKISIGNDFIYFFSLESDNENDSSIVSYITLDGIKILLTGDISFNTENRIIANYNIKDIDILKLGHHGSNSSSSKDFIKKMNPKYSVISVGANNRYGHPSKDVLERAKSSIIYRTDQDGGIMFKINNKVQIETCI